MSTLRRPISHRTISYSSIASNYSWNDVRSRSGAASLRLSMEEYYLSQSNRTSRRDSASSDSEHSDDPPSYDVAINGLHLPATRLKIEPRADQGREQLPAYSCSIMIWAVFSKKMELETAIQRAFDRNWYQVYAELQGTALRFYKVKSAGIFAGGGGPNTSADLPPYLKPGELLKIYSLQHADVGIAADYLKRPYVIRVRVEADQFLLSCVEIETFLLWMESLAAAIDLAPPLDERKLPLDTSYPQSHRRRGLRTETISEETMLVPSVAELPLDDAQSGRSVTNSSRPSTGAGSVALEDMLLSGPTTSSNEPNSRWSPTFAPASIPSHHAQAPASSLTRPIDLINYANPTPLPPPSSSRSHSQYRTHPDLTPDGKWRPHHIWSPRHDLLYAKRCMNLLLSTTPRKTNFMIMRGRQWIVDWATGALTRWEPLVLGEGWDEAPGYLELVGPWGAWGPGGTFLRS